MSVPRISEADSSLLLQSLGQGVHVIDRQGKIVFENAASLAMLGWTHRGLLGADAHSLVHHHRPGGEVYPECECPIHHTLMDGQRRRVRNEVFFRGDGSSFPVDYVCSPVNDGDGRIAGVAVCFSDMTDLQRAEEALRGQATMLLTAQRMGHMGSWAFDGRTRILQWSDATCELFGIAPEDFRGEFEQFMGFVVPADRARYLAVHAKVTAQAPLLEAEYRIQRPDGSVRWMSERGTARFDSAGTITARIGMVMDITEQKGAADQLAQNTMLARVASRVAGIGGWSMDLAERRLTWSDETCAIHEVPAGHMPRVEEGIALFPPEYRDRVKALVQRCIEDGTPYEFELPKLTAKGRPIWVRSMGEAVRDASGRIVRLQGAFQDITERRLAEEEARQKDSLLRFAGRIACIGGWAIELATEHVLWSDEVYQILEFDKSAAPALLSSLALYREPGRGRIVAALDACRRTGEPFDVEADMLTGGGRIICVRVCGEAVRGHDGTIVRLQGAIQDLTQLRAAQHAARESDERLAILARASKDAIWDWDLERDTVWCNANFNELCGPGTVVSSRSWQDHIHPSDRERVLQRIRDAMDGMAPTWSETYRIQPPQGGAGYVIGRGYITRDAAGRAVRMMGSTTDISERMALEERLRQTQRLESVGQLTGGVAHDFNNLLTVILGNAEMLAEQLAFRGECGPLHGMAHVVMDAAQRGAELTQRLLAFARKQALEPRKVDINQLVMGTDAMLRRTLGEHIRIEFKAEPLLWAAEVDPAQLDNTLLNLCLNSRDAMPGGGRLSIQTANVTLDAEDARRCPDSQPGAYVMLSVSDTGEGIAPQHVGRVFEPFFTTKEQGKGTGLGLAMTYGFVKQSGGHVNIESQPGRGTTVKLYLPRADGAAAPAAGCLHAKPAGGVETILLVEDDEPVRRYAHAQLVSLGYTVLHAGDGSHALQILDDDERKVDLLFTDVVMPGMSGRELADRALARRPGLRVLYTSGYAENAIVHDGRLDDGVKLLAKPYRRHELAQAVREILGAVPLFSQN
ncbi:PAS domain-containing protein [Ramlibacter ginsenosidimutans]|uniref:histidine kinase n=1 Tax=Ramlibacter ginsenosidimutans TaxID=502333 RepID=A0A934TTH2_9BURK|nr:PAS domain-containing protein [Ramlibacter ginsenosidimutans]MBK6007244.1 PAS domain-containing protein [Ramlibacter ginsenosidimutans]